MRQENSSNDFVGQRLSTADKIVAENNETHNYKKSDSMIQRSFSTISNKLLSTTLPRLSSSNSLKEQTSLNLKSPNVVKQETIRTDDPYGEVARGLESCYKKVLLPFEEKCNFHQFHYAKYDDCEFEAKPFVLLIGNKTYFFTYPIPLK